MSFTLLLKSGKLNPRQMQRDFDLIRKLLLFFDAKEGPEYVELPEVGPDYTDSQIKYHLVLLYQADLLTCEPVRSSTSERISYVIPFDLTWNGHELLAKIKNEDRWLKIKAAAAVEIDNGPLSFVVLDRLATQYALQAAGSQVPGTTSST